MPTVNPNNANQASLNLPPDSAKSADSTKMEGLSGIEYHIDVPDSVLQGAVFAFHRKAQQIKIMEFEHPQFTPTGAQFSDRLDALNGDYFLTVTQLDTPTFRYSLHLWCSQGWCIGKMSSPDSTRLPTT